MISARNLSKTFKLYKTPSDRLKEIVLGRSFHKHFPAVSNVSFEVQAGETLGIVGENGAGKSTILKLLTGILLPDTGTVHISGKITGLLELGTGFNSEFSGIDNIIHNATYMGLSRQEINERLEEIIAFTELNQFINEPIKTYSSGMVMRLAFSVAIHVDPKVFVVDEALSVGDAYFQQKCMKKIKQFKAGGGSIVFVSHDMNAVKVLCDQAILLEKGKVVEKADPETIINAYNFMIAKRSGDENVRLVNNDPSAGYGNRKVVINKIILTDKNNNHPKILICGHPLTISVSITGNEPVNDITIGFMIRDTFGQDMFGTNTCYMGKKISIETDQTMVINFLFNAFNLGPGKYSITVAAHTGTSHEEECFHWMDKGAVFEVVSGDGLFFAGQIRLTPEIKIGETFTTTLQQTTKPEVDQAGVTKSFS